MNDLVIGEMFPGLEQEVQTLQESGQQLQRSETNSWHGQTIRRLTLRLYLRQETLAEAVEWVGLHILLLRSITL